MEYIELLELLKHEKERKKEYLQNFHSDNDHYGDEILKKYYEVKSKYKTKKVN